MKEQQIQDFDFSLEDAEFKEQLWEQLLEAADFSADAFLLSDDELGLVSAAGEPQQQFAEDRWERKHDSQKGKPQ